MPARESGELSRVEVGTGLRFDEPPAVQTFERGERVVMEAIDPAARKSIASVFVTPALEIPALIARARKAGRVWDALSAGQRAQGLMRLRHLIAQQTDAIAETISRSTGKPLLEALRFDVAAVLHTLDECIGGPVAFLRTPPPVVCVIAPIGLPFERALSPAILALAAGSAVVVKPASSAALVSVLMARLFEHAFAEFPGLAQVVHGGAQLGSLLATAEDVDCVIFSGSRGSARKLREALEPLRRLASFEPLSVASLIVCDDANLERAANATVFGRYCNNGQGGGSVNRVYVQRAVAAEFVHKVVHKVRALKSGPYTDPHCELGPLASGRGLQHLRGVVQDALDQRAAVLTGGMPPHAAGPALGGWRGAQGQGFYWPPTVLTDVARSTRLMREETFGPILAVTAVEDEREAIVLANETSQGFGACVFSGDRVRAGRVAAQLHVRLVAVNDLLLKEGAPGGYWQGEQDESAGEGAAGRRQDATQRVLVGNGDTDREPTWFPYSPAKLRAAEAALAGRAARRDQFTVDGELIDG
ncbi:MAG TPA: aldehyde dehydrogenase family protein [Burkholderiales bacterium]|nr:aldehyde dehydrogenase family protein [Burkholderiales bacterium]